ncbi:phytanoyl-CoA dioxygenase family protein [Salmonella enterica]|nr:phytanoyl-CoA dioxygenase family protein [Escherichia coli]EJG7106937.1 phytanoyl-CoA dioxygenase family protein [Escherichia coli]ELV6610578.1 phytanoyl-CoA dioxygenase family protein [Salmonella enterica]HCP8239115.1 phytanoyl-CoA dioxygenase family protein [Escherichia coli]
MTPEQEQAFREKGCVHIPGALVKGAVFPVRDHVLKELKRQNIWSAGRTLSQKLKGVPIFQQTGKLGQVINFPSLNEKLISRDLYSDMCQLADAPLHGQDGQLLISLPHKVAWSLEGLNWHRDISKSQLKGLPGVQAFVLLDDVAVHGGATLALAGSHRLDSQSEAKQGISELIGHGGQHSANIGGVELSIIEMSGRPGDVYLMDMRVLHTPSINSTKKVRMMATARYFAE